jgi:hypothetical protein
MYTTVEAAVTLHNRLLQHMLRLPKAFFDTNPAGVRRCLMLLGERLFCSSWLRCYALLWRNTICMHAHSL